MFLSRLENLHETEWAKRLTLTSTALLSSGIILIALGINIFISEKPTETIIVETTTKLETELETETFFSANEEADTQTESITKVETSEVATEETTEYKMICQWADFEITRKEFELLCTTVFCEAGNQDLNTQYMVALTILNRVVSNNYPDTIAEVIYQRDKVGTPQYSVINWSDFENRGWTEQVEKAVGLALFENHHPRDMYYFRTKHFHLFGVDYEQSGDLFFSTKEAISYETYPDYIDYSN